MIFLSFQNKKVLSTLLSIFILLCIVYTTRIAHVQEMSFGGINSLTFMPLEICSIKSLDICFFYHQFLQYVESVLKKLLLPWIFKNMHCQSWAPFGALEYMTIVLGLIVFFLFDKELHSSLFPTLGYNL